MQEELYDELRRIEDVHWWLTTRRSILLQFLTKIFRTFLSSPLVLDCGSATGTLAKHLHSKARLVGLDCSVKGVESSGDLKVGAFVQAKAEYLPFLPHTFDVVCAFDLLEHLDDDGEALRMMRQVLKPDGYLLVSVPAYRFLWGKLDDAAHHKRRYTRRDLRNKLTASRFVLEKATYFNSLLFPLVLFVRLCERATSRLRRRDAHSDFELAPPGFINNLLGKVFRLELPYLRHFNFPFGGSILCIARKT